MSEHDVFIPVRIAFLFWSCSSTLPQSTAAAIPKTRRKRSRLPMISMNGISPCNCPCVKVRMIELLKVIFLFKLVVNRAIEEAVASATVFSNFGKQLWSLHRFFLKSCFCDVKELSHGEMIDILPHLI